MKLSIFTVRRSIFSYAGTTSETDLLVDACEVSDQFRMRGAKNRLIVYAKKRYYV